MRRTTIRMSHSTTEVLSRAARGLLAVNHSERDNWAPEAHSNHQCDAQFNSRPFRPDKEVSSAEETPQADNSHREVDNAIRLLEAVFWTEQFSHRIAILAQHQEFESPSPSEEQLGTGC